MTNETPIVTTPSELKTYIVHVNVGQLISNVYFTDEIQASSVEEAQEKVAQMLQDIEISRAFQYDDRFDVNNDPYFEEFEISSSLIDVDCS